MRVRDWGIIEIQKVSSTCCRVNFQLAEKKNHVGQRKLTNNDLSNEQVILNASEHLRASRLPEVLIYFNNLISI